MPHPLSAETGDANGEDHEDTEGTEKTTTAVPPSAAVAVSVAPLADSSALPSGKAVSPLLAPAAVASPNLRKAPPVAPAADRQGAVPSVGEEQEATRAQQHEQSVLDRLLFADGEEEDGLPPPGDQPEAMMMMMMLGAEEEANGLPAWAGDDMQPSEGRGDADDSLLACQASQPAPQPSPGSPSRCSDAAMRAPGLAPQLVPLSPVASSECFSVDGACSAPVAAHTSSGPLPESVAAAEMAEERDTASLRGSPVDLDATLTDASTCGTGPEPQPTAISPWPSGAQCEGSVSGSAGNILPADPQLRETRPSLPGDFVPWQVSPPPPPTLAAVTPAQPALAPPSAPGSTAHTPASLCASPHLHSFSFGGNSSGQHRASDIFGTSISVSHSLLDEDDEEDDEDENVLRQFSRVEALSVAKMQDACLLLAVEGEGEIMDSAARSVRSTEEFLYIGAMGKADDRERRVLMALDASAGNQQDSLSDSTYF